MKLTAYSIRGAIPFGIVPAIAAAAYGGATTGSNPVPVLEGTAS
jgi:hypothetical protein